MAKTYEALKRAEREYKKSRLNDAAVLQKDATDRAVLRNAENDNAVLQKVDDKAPAKSIELTETSNRISRIKVLEPYEELKAALFSRYDSDSIKSILFNATSHGAGCSTTALHFAAALAQGSKQKVILVEVNLRTPGLRKKLKIDDAPELSEIVANFGKMSPRIEIVGPENLYVIACGGGSLIGPLGLFESDEFDRFMRMIRTNFDYVILDAPPVPIFSEFRILCSKVDGVILVAEAGKTRRQVMLQAKKELEAAGGRFLGVVLNKRKFYIPKWIYKRL